MEGKLHSEPESEEVSVEENKSVPGELQPWGQVSSCTRSNPTSLSHHCSLPLCDAEG